MIRRKAGSSGLRRKNSCQKPSLFSTSPPSYTYKSNQRPSVFLVFLVPRLTYPEKLGIELNNLRLEIFGPVLLCERRRIHCLSRALGGALALMFFTLASQNSCWN